MNIVKVLSQNQRLSISSHPYKNTTQQSAIKNSDGYLKNKERRIETLSRMKALQMKYYKR